MLIKCVCSNCGHSYLSDDEAGELACPRCDSSEAPPYNADAGPDHDDRGFEPDYYTDLDAEIPAHDGPPRFQAKAPPAMFLTRERFMRGLAFGGLTTGTAGALIGAAMAASSVDVPGLAAFAIAAIAGVTARAGFGGRTVRQTSGRASVASTIVVLIGFAGLIAGLWGVERLAGERSRQTHADLDEGLKNLTAQYGDTQDAGAAIVIKERIAEVERLRALSDPQLEDYLSIQEAQVNNALLAHAKLRATTAPIVKLGPGNKPIRLPRKATIPIRVVELLLAIGIAARAVRPGRASARR